MKNDNIRRFTMRILLNEGIYYDIERECYREIPPTPDYILQDTMELIRYNETVNITTIEGRHVTVVSNAVIGVEMLNVNEGMDIEKVKLKYAK